MRNFIWAVPAILMAMPIFASADTILPGTDIAVKTDNPIELHQWDAGRIYGARVAHDVFARDGRLVIPRDSYAQLIVRQVAPGEMALDLESVTVNGTRYVMDITGPQFNMPANQYNSGTGLLGNIVGAISNGNVQIRTRGNEIFVPENAMITFQLQEPLHVANGNEPGYYRNGNWYHNPGEWYR